MRPVVAEKLEAATDEGVNRARRCLVQTVVEIEQDGRVLGKEETPALRSGGDVSDERVVAKARVLRSKSLMRFRISCRSASSSGSLVAISHCVPSAPNLKREYTGALPLIADADGIASVKRPRAVRDRPC
jgi:hypothetical protein